jgi:hypothetical protein
MHALLPTTSRILLRHRFARHHHVLCILDQGGQVVSHKDLPTDPDALLEAIAPYRDETTVTGRGGSVNSRPWLGTRPLVTITYIGESRTTYLATHAKGNCLRECFDKNSLSMNTRHGLLISVALAMQLCARHIEDQRHERLTKAIGTGPIVFSSGINVRQVLDYQPVSRPR